MAVPRSRDHERLVEGAKAGSLGLGMLQAGLKLVLARLKEPDVRRGTVEKRDLGRLLVGHRKNFLQAAVSLAQLVSATLFRLDALAADLLAAIAGDFRTGSCRRRKIVVIIREIICLLHRASTTARR